MPCYFPLQARYSLRADGKRDIQFDNVLARMFYSGLKIDREDHISLPCGRCLGCRLERSRQWADRCVHEAKMSKRGNMFLTLTYSPEHCPKDMSLDKKVMPKFIKALRNFAIPDGLRSRKKVDLRKLWVKENPIKFFYCGEYGGQLGRPHYHLLVFNFEFADKRYWKTVNGCKYYISDSLSSLWPYGFSTIGSVTFDSAAYVARYALKKVTGERAEEHYKRVVVDDGQLVDLVPEFAVPSRRPGIGFSWFEKYANTDVIPNDNIISRGHPTRVPRYYDMLWDRKDPDSFALAKAKRVERAVSQSEENSFRRLQTRLKCKEAQISRLIRTME